MRRKQTILRSAASATLALGVMFSLVQCNEATGGTDASSSSSSSVSTSRPDDDDDDDNSSGSSSSSSSGSESGSPLDEFGTVSGGTLTLKDSLTSENAGELNEALKNSNITSVDFSKVKSIPGDVLNGTSVTKVTVSTWTVVNNAFSGISGLTIAVTDGGSGNTLTRSILGGASDVTLDLSAASLETIEYNTFSECTGLTSVTLPDSLKTIEGNAFKDCTSLTSVTMPEKLTSIEGFAFYGCTSLTSINLPEGLTTIEGSTFYRCSNLTSVTLPVGLKSIGSSAFEACTSLTSVDLPEGLESIGNSAFSSCSSLTSVTLPEGLESLGDSAFSSCLSLESITLPESLTSIGQQTFYGCTALTSITLPEGLKSLGKSAFWACSKLTRADLSACTSLNTIGEDTFKSCGKLAYVTLPNRTGAFSIAKEAFAFFSLNEKAPLALCIPNENMAFDSIDSTAFTNRIVTLYGDGENANAIKNALEIAGVKGTGEDGEIEVKNVSAFPDGSVQTGLSLFNLPF